MIAVAFYGEHECTLWRSPDVSSPGGAAEAGLHACQDRHRQRLQACHRQNDDCVYYERTEWRTLKRSGIGLRDGREGNGECDGRRVRVVRRHDHGLAGGARRRNEDCHDDGLWTRPLQCGR